MSLPYINLAHEYQIACMEWFRNMHEGHSGDGVGNHPNSYYSESVEYWAAIDKKAGKDLKTEGA